MMFNYFAGRRGRSLAIAVFLAALWLFGAAAAAGFSWSSIRKKPEAWFRSDEGRRVLENVLSQQTAAGSWPKNTDTAARKLSAEEQKRLHGTFDNGATTDEMRLLARAFRVTGEQRYRAAFDRALDVLFKAQYDNGGWPQSYPPGRQYPRHITFNDSAMVRIMELMRDITHEPDFAFLDQARRERARKAFDKGIECILKCQIVVKGKRTAWCAQHDEVTLEPRKARTYEHPSISGSESVGVVQLLMSLERPGPEVVEAVEAACRWFEEVKLTGIKEVKRDGDRQIVRDPNASPLWARFYEIGTNRPMFSGRDGVIKYDVREIEHERRNGYSWYGNGPASALREWPKWRKRHAPAPK